MNYPTNTFGDLFGWTHEVPKCTLNFVHVPSFWREPTPEEKEENPNTFMTCDFELFMPHMWWGFTSFKLEDDVEKESEYMFCSGCNQKRKRLKKEDKIYSHA